MLVVCVLASALGALIMCLLVLRSGFSLDQDFLITRLGHAMAGVCFATTAILCAVLIATPARESIVPPPASTPSPAPSRRAELERSSESASPSTAHAPAPAPITHP